MPLPLAAIAGGVVRGLAAGATRAVAAGATRAAASGALRAAVGETAQAGIAATARATAGKMAANPALVQGAVRGGLRHAALSGTRTGLGEAASGRWRGYTGSQAILGQPTTPGHLGYNFGPTGNVAGRSGNASSITRTLNTAAYGSPYASPSTTWNPSTPDPQTRHTAGRGARPAPVRVDSYSPDDVRYRVPGLNP